MRFHAVSSMTTECVDRSCSGQDLPTVRHSALNEVFLPSMQRNPIATDDQRMAAFDDDHVLVVVVHMLRGYGVFKACPERHLAPITSVKHVVSTPGVAWFDWEILLAGLFMNAGNPCTAVVIAVLLSSQSMASLALSVSV
jgi:hypothetical protein